MLRQPVLDGVKLVHDEVGAVATGALVAPVIPVAVHGHPQPHERGECAVVDGALVGSGVGVLDVVCQVMLFEET